MMKENKNIKCDVTSCSYNDKAGTYCTLNDVKISAQVSPDAAETKGDTICQSFACENGDCTE